jgi:ubiquinone/menaquinone biosynthesis C-methylase UbiE
MTPRRSSHARLILLVLAAAAITATTFTFAQGSHPVSGRRIASVMDAQGAAWLDRPEREREEAPTRAIAALDIRAGQTVADIGAGSGYYTVRLAEVVGPGGRIYATDIQPEMLALIRKRLAQTTTSGKESARVELVLGTQTESKLPDGTIDLALMVDVYHELAQPQAFLRSLKRAMKRDGRLVLIEFRKESDWVPIREEHKMSVREARMELEAEGFTFDRVIDVLPWQHILVFTVQATH